jgi:hypothetical protein
VPFQHNQRSKSGGARAGIVWKDCGAVFREHLFDVSQVSLTKYNGHERAVAKVSTSSSATANMLKQDCQQLRPS